MLQSLVPDKFIVFVFNFFFLLTKIKSNIDNKIMKLISFVIWTMDMLILNYSYIILPE